ncbi:MAG TPA: sugar phosphate nucleotidyltransferase [Bacteroidales bacterium]|nr:sugar phosphate nucleotidyltransferase [Bacteroidales bacterium]
MKPTLLILAAGIGSRYGGLKQLDPIGPSGETIVDYSIYDALQSGFGKVVFIIKEEIEKDFREVFYEKLKNHVAVDYVMQEIWKVPEGVKVPEERRKPWGTGHAILMADGTIDGPFAVINSDDFYGRGAYQKLAEYYQGWSPSRENDYCMVGYRVANTLSEFGAVSRGVCQTDANGFLLDVVERTQIARGEKGICFSEKGQEFPLADNTTVSMNFWGFTPSFFGFLRTGFDDFIRKNVNELKSEYYIPTEVNHLIRERRATVRVLPCVERWFGMTYHEDREQVVKNIRSLIKNGVYPENLWS